MPETLAAALALDGLGWLLAAALMAGIVRGFAGFGTAMIYLPVAGQILPPVWALTSLIVMDLIGPAPNLPRALRDGHPADIARLLVGALLTLPLGVLVLVALDPAVFRYAVSAVALVLVVILVLGVRYRGTLTPALVYATGGMGGFLGGVTGVPGPPVILLYMASPHPPEVIRANNTVFLWGFAWAFLGLFALSGRLEATPLLVGLMVTLPYLAGNLLGAWVFDPDKARVYRVVAYAIITASALMGLPLWG